MNKHVYIQTTAAQNSNKDKFWACIISATIVAAAAFGNVAYYFIH